MSTDKRFEIGEFGEPLDFEDKLMRIRIFRHGRRYKLQLESLLPPPPTVSRPKLLDNPGVSGKTTGSKT